jgi:hypothetical protein
MKSDTQYLNEQMHMAIKKMHILTMAKKLEEKGIEPNIYEDHKIQMLDDAVYSRIINEVNKTHNNRQTFINEVTEICRDRCLFEAFSKDQKSELEEISSHIKFKHVKSFFDEEIKRLQDSARPKEDEKKFNEIRSEDGQKKINEDKIKKLISLNPIMKIDLKEENFSMLIKGYFDNVNSVMGNSKEDKGKIKLFLTRSTDIGEIIDKNKDSLEWLGKKNLLEDSREHASDIIDFTYAMSYRGDLKNLQTLTEKLGDENFRFLLSLIPENKNEVDYSKVITISGIMDKIKKRTERAGEKSNEWRKLDEKFTTALQTLENLSNSPVLVPNLSLKRELDPLPSPQVLQANFLAESLANKDKKKSTESQYWGCPIS